MNAGGEQGGSSVSDEEWERFLRESEAGSPDAPKEPSARARIVARRLREDPSGGQAWRTYTPVRPRRRTGWYVAGLLAALALLLVALAPGRVLGWFGGETGSTGPLAAESERPDQPPPAQDPQRPTLDEPFKGSPAALWADGAAGITVPTAKATGWMNTAQVAQALARTRDFLAASSLDPGVLAGGRPEQAIALINPKQQDVQGFLKTSLRTPSKDNDPLLLFSRFDKSSARLVGDVVRTRGRMTFREGERGALQVTTDVTYVYPVVRAAPNSDEVTRTIARREVVLSWDDPAKVHTDPGTFSLISYKLDMTNGGCGANTGYFAPEFGADRLTNGADAGSRVDPYDRSTPMSDRTDKGSNPGCGTATRS
ncbi:hypothetical protein [Streptomyces sp. NPDC048442]|uniref:hypothetical protein n=1 Tax=Streptomyces sp. NPDC048442 TaxID=3154823 RepID=UPI0034247FDE